MNAVTPKTDESPSQPEAALPPELEAARNGDKLTDGQEKSALDWLLGASRVLEYDLPVDYETPDGEKKLTFHFKQLDPDKLSEIDGRHRKGDGPFARLDTHQYNLEVTAEATLYITDETGRKIELQSEEFRGGAPGGASFALGLRFKGQGGIFEGIVAEIQRVSGYSPERVGTAQRALVEAGKDS